MVSYEVKPVVCDYGVFENSELKLILNSLSNANLIKEILELDNKHQQYNKVKVCKDKELEEEYEHNNRVWESKRSKQ